MVSSTGDMTSCEYTKHGENLLKTDSFQGRRPRRGSNAQPPDSKSVTLSIELRGRATKIITENGIMIELLQRLEAFKGYRKARSQQAALNSISKCSVFVRFDGRVGREDPDALVQEHTVQ